MEEKSLISEALQVYLQLVARQMPQQHVQKIVEVAQNIIKKLDTLDYDKKKGNKPAGISDEWYNSVCKHCDKLSPSGCLDKVTEKFPGKCDPILHYEQKKIAKQRK